MPVFHLLSMIAMIARGSTALGINYFVDALHSPAHKVLTLAKVMNDGMQKLHGIQLISSSRPLAQELRPYPWTHQTPHSIYNLVQFIIKFLYCHFGCE
jgi:hypothetical protein